MHLVGGIALAGVGAFEVGDEGRMLDREIVVVLQSSGLLEGV